MKIGKLPNSLLEKLVLNSLESRRNETILPPGIGEDCCALDLGKNLCVVSTDPITAADENAGILSVLISLNDLAASGAEPVGILTTVLLPPGSDESYIRKLFRNINNTCARMNIDILGGHTEVTESVRKTVIITTAIGKTGKEGLVRSDGAQEGDAILMTKSAGLEGTSIICSDREADLGAFLSIDEINEGKSYIGEVSVVEEGLAAASIGVNAMHDITEGGVLGAVWEICKASEKGAEIDIDKIPVRSVTEKLCRHYSIDPLRLISSGSLIIVCRVEKKDIICKKLTDSGIDCTFIGSINASNEILLRSGNESLLAEEPGPDELYKVI